ncbi:MAG: 6,7-dimethyl-8-ribityllumazine synthase [Legionellales bacterium RIFCSPHIGHO2_12_FULL_42_9]|nr:MAG: 6,7-dimethyl-8-ribityllumazine synthase [Legionellales bacterium RIFCSPHIGHO2_12_FULL_42_9]
MNRIGSSDEFKVPSFPIAIVVSLFNQEITSALKDGAVARLLERGVLEHDILLVEVPGAIEIPITAAHIAKNKQASVIIALGSVIYGETDHYDCVFEQINYGCQRVALDYHVPVIFEVLMTENEEQAFDRLGGSHGHKGTSAADCAIDMYRVLQQLQNVRNNS